jgi:hypothetical protein
MTELEILLLLQHLLMSEDVPLTGDLKSDKYVSASRFTFSPNKVDTKPKRHNLLRYRQCRGDEDDRSKCVTCEWMYVSTTSMTVLFNVKWPHVFINISACPRLRGGNFKATV